MNIFVLHKNPRLCAQYHCDKHVLKQIPDIAKILCTVMRENGIPYGYTSGNKNHPCVRWVAEADSNFVWLRELGLELCKEYGYRYEKGAADHASEGIIRNAYLKSLESMSKLKKASNLEEITLPPLCIPDYLKLDDPIQAYRQYYLVEKADLLSYTKRNVPEWITCMGMGEHR